MSDKYKSVDQDGELVFFIKRNKKGVSAEVWAPVLFVEQVVYPDVTYVALSEGKGGCFWTQDDLDFCDYEPTETIPIPQWVLDDLERKWQKEKRNNQSKKICK